MEENKISDLMDVTMTKLRQLADTNTIVGSPITTPDGITVIPVSRISFGFGTAGASGGGAKGVKFTGGNGAGVKVEPIGFLVVKDGACRMISVAPPPGTTIDRVVEMVPDVLDKIESMLNKNKTEKV